MPPASFAATALLLILSSKVVLPWSTCPRTQTIGWRNIESPWGYLGGKAYKSLLPEQRIEIKNAIVFSTSQNMEAILLILLLYVYQELLPCLNFFRWFHELIGGNFHMEELQIFSLHDLSKQQQSS